MQVRKLSQGADVNAPNGSQNDDLERRSRDLAREAVAAFGKVVEEMTRIREFHGEICTNLEQFADLVGTGTSDVRQLDVLEREVATLSEALAVFAEMTVSPEARNKATEAAAELELIEKSGQVLAAIASLMGTTIASLGLKNLDTFLTELKETANSIQESAGSVTGLIAGVDYRGRQLMNSCSQARSELTDLSRKLNGPRDVLDQLSTDEAQATADLSGRARGLTRDGKSHLNSFITAMQFSDRLAQRLDHLGTILTMVDASVVCLPAAQARRCAADIEVVSTDVKATMGRLAELGREGAKVFSEGRLADMIQVSLTTRAKLVDLVMNEMSSVQNILDTAKIEAAKSSEIVTTTAKSFAGLKFASKNLALASYNSMLVSNRYSHASGPMKVLSREVRQIASDCLGSVDHARSCIAEVNKGGDVAQENLHNATETFNDHLEAFQGQTKTVSKRLADINTMRDSSGKSAEALLLMVDAVSESMYHVDNVAKALHELATQLDAMAQPDAELNTDLVNRLWSIYTMEEERDVHAQVFGSRPDNKDPGANIGSRNMATTGAGDSVDVDDLLF